MISFDPAQLTLIQLVAELSRDELIDIMGWSAPSKYTKPVLIKAVLACLRVPANAAIVKPKLSALGIRVEYEGEDPIKEFAYALLRGDPQARDAAIDVLTRGR